MTVKDLVGLFEPSKSTQRQRATSRTSDEVPLIQLRGLPSHASHRPPPPSPARFIKRRKSEDASAQNSRSGLVQHPIDLTTPFHDFANDSKTMPIASTMDHHAAASSSTNPDSQHSKLSSVVNGSNEDKATSDTAYKDTKLGRRVSSASTLVQSRHFGPHTPVPATVVFARNAAPLYLPKLDEHLATITPPAFTPVPSKGKDQDQPMFPPMDLLSASGKSLDDLEANSAIPPVWKNRTTILGTLVSIAIGLTGSSLLASYYSLQGLLNTVQIFALILSTIVPVRGKQLESQWEKLFLGTIPNVLALNFASTLAQSLFFLMTFMAIAAVLLYFYHRSTFHCDRYNCAEGLQQPEPKGKQSGLVAVTFLLTVIYLPLSTLAMHVLVWSQDLWVVPNPYLNATSLPPVLPPLGPSTEYRDPLDFCWTTTMKKSDVNYAPIVIIISALVLVFMTIYFPISLHRVIQKSVPKVDPFTELGRRRSPVDMNREYRRLLGRDLNPFAFLYSGYRRGWGSYEATFLMAKLSTLLIIAVIDPDNCLFRSLSRTRVATARQIILLMSTSSFFLVQCFLAPFVDPVSNASEFNSRLNYVSTSLLALLVALKVPGYALLNSTVLYVIYGIAYGFSFYFIFIDMSFARRLVKRISRRIDFSIDIFSPRLDLSPTSPHTKRRIWQESITALFLTNADCAIPPQQRMIFIKARDFEYPPYLLDFCGFPGERHVENLKILREVGSSAYSKAVALLSGPDYAWFTYLESEVQQHFVGPDCYWKNPNGPSYPGCTSFFGNAWWIPFPPTLVMQYDDGPLVVIREVLELEIYIAQNSSPDVRRRREIRMSLRALEGQIVTWPYEHIRPVGSYSLWCCGNRDYSAQTAVHYLYCTVRIKRHGHLLWQDTQLGSGFGIQLTYGKNVQVDGTVIGLNDNFDLTPALARFLAMNRRLIPHRLEHIEASLADYRQHHIQQYQSKSNVLTYRFLTFVYDRPRSPTGLAESSIEFERDPRVRQLMEGHTYVFQSAYERLDAATRSELTNWWYLFWDDLWRRNHDTISGLQKHASDFNPYYPTSIAYTPLPRPALEAFLIQRGLMSKIPRWDDYFYSGFLNKMYLRLNETVFRGSSRAIMFHVGDDASERDMGDVDMTTQARTSTLGTGAGTDHDDLSILDRPAYRWEGLLRDSPHKRKPRRRRWFTKLGAWFGITPIWRADLPSRGLSLDVHLENGRYVLLSPEEFPSPTLDSFEYSKSQFYEHS